MPLSKEKMREYMIEYRKNHPEYEEKRKKQSIEKAVIRYHTDEEFRRKMVDNSIRYYYNKKNSLLSVNSVVAE